MVYLWYIIWYIPYTIYIYITVVYYIDMVYDQTTQEWAVLVSHIKQRTQQQWLQKDNERKGREEPWSHTSILRVRADEVRVPQREVVVPRLLAFDEVEADGEEE